MNRIIQQMHANTLAQNTVAPSYSERQKVVVFVRELQTYHIFKFTLWNLAKTKKTFDLSKENGTYLNQKTAVCPLDL